MQFNLCQILTFVGGRLEIKLFCLQNKTVEFIIVACRGGKKQQLIDFTVCVNELPLNILIYYLEHSRIRFYP